MKHSTLSSSPNSGNTNVSGIPKRPIKFRAWDSDAKIMYEWNCDFFSDMSPVTGYGSNFPEQEHITLMQFTGLIDKNGKDIYEGDFLGGEIYDSGYIQYCNDCKQFQYHIPAWACMACEGDVHWYEIVDAANKNELEVIGNVFENPELLG